MRATLRRVVGDGDNDWQLERVPAEANASLRAWTTADVALLDHARDSNLIGAQTRLLIVNDEFGALGVGVGQHHPQWWSDSYVSARALRHNLELNGIEVDAVTCVPGDAVPNGPIDLVLMRFPKSLAWLEDQLLRLRPSLAPGAQVIAGGMIKHTPRRAFELLEECIGPTKTGLGWKKSRLAFATFDADLACDPGVSAKVIDVNDMRLSSRPNVFSWAALDLGARALLPHLAAPQDATSIVDQGCGNGVLGLALARDNPDARIVGIDESFQAVASARDNAAAAGLSPDRVSFEVTDDLQDAGIEAADLIVCNPPFHQSHTIGDHIAWAMFSQAKQALRQGGVYLIVGNRHLDYSAKLKRLFGNCVQVAADKRFVVLRATKR